MSRKTRTLALTATAVAAALTLAACSGSSSDASGSTAEEGFGDLSIQLTWIKNAEFAGEYFAMENGYFEEAGFSEVNLLAGPGATESIVLSGEALVGLSSPVAVAPVILEEGAPLKIIGTTYQKNPFTIVSLPSAPIDTPEDMVGKKIGVQAGGNETLFEALLEANGIDPESVETVPVEYDPSVLVNGEVEGFFGYVTNELLTLELGGHEPHSLPFADNGLPFIAESFVVTQDSIDTNREALKAFLYAEILGWKDALADPEESARLAVEVYGADLGLDPEKELQQAIAQNEQLVVTEETDANGLFTISNELIDANIEILALAGYDIAADQLFDMSLLAEVYEEHPELLN
ncbi:ABC transporter substrate-binding protein [Diaminobutyricimonas sp. LJ205]|uniref:ABC transporter substrate-binding protein n=1 Tax=Diaminobutyricimonas sp. LJ205 TaxID=2683590 RepID=UPI0012F47CD9|nr:ABC transporter substrate-binding protein [Diaminobutyricimonas sp. LJ205]